MLDFSVRLDDESSLHRHSCRIDRAVADFLMLVVDAEELIESGVPCVDGGEVAMLVDETVGDAIAVDVESVGNAEVVHADDLRLRRIREVFGRETGLERQYL